MKAKDLIEFLKTLNPNTVVYVSGEMDEALDYGYWNPVYNIGVQEVPFHCAQDGTRVPFLEGSSLPGHGKMEIVCIE